MHKMDIDDWVDQFTEDLLDDGGYWDDRHPSTYEDSYEYDEDASHQVVPG